MESAPARATRKKLSAVRLASVGLLTSSTHTPQAQLHEHGHTTREGRWRTAPAPHADLTSHSVHSTSTPVTHVVSLRPDLSISRLQVLEQIIIPHNVGRVVVKVRLEETLKPWRRDHSRKSAPRKSLKPSPSHFFFGRSAAVRALHAACKLKEQLARQRSTRLRPDFLSAACRDTARCTRASAQRCVATPSRDVFLRAPQPPDRTPYWQAWTPRL